jgi:hypothetical protein
MDRCLALGERGALGDTPLILAALSKLFVEMLLLAEADVIEVFICC